MSHKNIECIGTAGDTKVPHVSEQMQVHAPSLTRQTSHGVLSRNLLLQSRSAPVLFACDVKKIGKMNLHKEPSPPGRQKKITCRLGRHAEPALCTLSDGKSPIL